MTGDASSRACDYCRYSDIACSLDSSASNRKPRKAFPLVPKASPKILSRLTQDVDEHALPPTDACRDLINVYFDTLDHTEGSLFHRRSFVKEFEEGKLPRILLLGVFALAARFSDHPYFQGTDRWERGAKWVQEVKRLFNFQTIDVSITSLQACHLLASLAASEGDSDTLSLCNVLATRMVYLLDLPRVLSPKPLQREIELRGES